MHAEANKMRTRSFPPPPPVQSRIPGDHGASVSISVHNNIISHSPGK